MLKFHAVFNIEPQMLFFITDVVVLSEAAFTLIHFTESFKLFSTLLYMTILHIECVSMCCVWARLLLVWVNVHVYVSITGVCQSS